MKKFIMLICVLLIAEIPGFSQDYTLPLWSENIPNFQKTDEVEIRDSSDVVRISVVQRPEIAVYLPSRRIATGQAVVICPGGGYIRLAYDSEGTDVAKLLNSWGIAAIVLKYRLPISKSNLVGHKSPLMDAQRAIRLTRFYAPKWNIQHNKIGIMGFSAGGHLASTAGTHFDFGDASTGDPIDALSSRPDFMILIYPVITFSHSFMHEGSRNALLGESPDSALIKYYSNELQVTKETPPTFIIHASDDESVPVENSLGLYQTLKENGVSVEMHIYRAGGHGFSLAIGKGYLSTWTERCRDWINWLNQTN